jgi:GNAT superfamily N-acetyltransferase
VNVQIEIEPIETLEEQAKISAAFLVQRILEVSRENGGLGDFQLTERVVSSPWTKDYDAISGEGPTQWRSQFDVSGWGLIAAYDGKTRVGGAVIAPDMKLKQAILWDMRVRPESRSLGVGTALFRAVEEWSRSTGCAILSIETQDINVPACRFYERNGCELRSMERFAYPDFPDETKLLWCKNLAPDSPG